MSARTSTAVQAGLVSARRRGPTPGRVLTHVILTIASLSILLPVLWIARTSFAHKQIAYRIPPEWFFTPTLDNYRTIFVEQPFLKYFGNSIVIAGASALIALAVGSLAGYSFARFKTGGNALRVLVLGTQMLPPVTLVIPMFVLARTAELLDTHAVLIVVYLAFTLPFVVWILTGFFAGIPVEIEEAALVDGCSRFEAFWRVVLPLSLPGLLAAGVFAFVLAWNEFLFALVLTGKDARTIPVATSGLMTQMGTNIGAVCAATVLMIAPIVALTFVIQRYLVRGLTLGAVK